MSLFDEQAFRALVEQAAEKAVRKVLREEPSSTGVDGRWVPTSQLANGYSIARGTIRQWIRAKKLRSVKVGGALRVNLADFERLVTGSNGSDKVLPSPEELADRDEIRERRSKKA